MWETGFKSPPRPTASVWGRHSCVPFSSTVYILFFHIPSSQPFFLFILLYSTFIISTPSFSPFLFISLLSPYHFFLLFTPYPSSFLRSSHLLLSTFLLSRLLLPSWFPLSPFSFLCLLPLFNCLPSFPSFPPSNLLSPYFFYLPSPPVFLTLPFPSYFPFLIYLPFSFLLLLLIPLPYFFLLSLPHFLAPLFCLFPFPSFLPALITSPYIPS